MKNESTQDSSKTDVIYCGLADVPKVQGIIMIDFTVQCPHCDENIYQSMDREWFEKTMGRSFPTDGVDGDYEAECPQCKKYFTIEGFCQ